MSKPRFSRRLTFRLALVAAAVILLIVVSPIRRLLGFVEKPFVVAGTWVTEKTFGFFQPSAVSSARVSELENQLAAVSAVAANDAQLQTDNADLRARLNFQTRTSAKLVSADIVARTIGVQTSRFAIDRGSNDGIAVGMAAVTGDGILAGKVTAVTASGATVSAVTDQTVSTAVSLLNDARTIGIATGLDGTLLTLEYIPKDVVVNANDLVVTSGLEDLVPSGLVIGMVNAVQSNDIDPFKTAVIQPLADVRRLDSVSIIVNQAP